MAQKTVNLGTGYNTKDGDSVRDAFNKVNQNFTELYTLTGGTVADLTEIAQDYAAEMFVNATHTGITVNYDDVNNVLELTGFDGDYNSLTNLPTLNSFDPSAVSESIIPDTDVAYDLGSATNRFRDLYLSGSTIDLGGTTLSIVGGNLQVGGTDIKDVVTTAGIDYTDIQNVPTIPTLGNFTLSGNNITASSGAEPILLKIFGGDAADPPALINREWSFNTNGSITFPDATVQTTAYTGGTGTGDITFTGNVISSSDLSNDTNGIVLDPGNKPFIIGPGTWNGGGYDGLSFQYFVGDRVEISQKSGTNDELVINSDGSIRIDTGATGTDIILSPGGSAGEVDISTGAGLRFPDDTIQSTAWTGSAPGLTYSDPGGGGSTEVGLSADIFDFGTGNTVDLQGNTILFSSATISNFAPGSIYALNGQYLYVASASASATTTNVAFTYDTNISNVRQTFYGKTEFGNNGQAPIVDFTGATVTGWTDPNVVNEHEGSVVIVVGGQTATIDDLTVRLENNAGALDVAFNYDPAFTSAISANGDLANRFGGTTNLTSGNTTWTVLNILNIVGDKGEFTVVDHSSHKMYRGTVIARSLPDVGVAGDAYCVLERVM